MRLATAMNCVLKRSVSCRLVTSSSVVTVAQQPAFGVAHRRGAQPVAAFLLADPHGQHRCFALGGHRLLHRNSVANGTQNLFAARRVGQRHAIARRFAQQLRRRLVHLQHVSLAVGHDDGLKNRLQHGVRKLKLHLPASRFGIAQLAQAHRNAVQLAGDHAEIVAAAPIHAVFQISFCNVFRIARQHANGAQNKKQRADANHDRRNCENDAEPTLSRRVERRSSDECQSHREGGQQNASENQTLSEIQHAPGSMPEEGLLSFWGKHPPCAKSWTEEIKPLKAPKRTQGI